MAQVEDREFQRRIGRIEGLVRQVEGLADPTAQAMAKELMQLLLDLHGAGLERMLDMLYDSGAAGQALISDLAKDELVSSLLLLHGLHPFSLETRVMQALEQVRPYMKSHGGNVALLGVTDEGVVGLRLEGSCHGCQSSRVTLRYAVEEAIYAAAPDVTAIEVEGAVEAQPGLEGFIPVSELLSPAQARASDEAATARNHRAHSDGDSARPDEALWITVEGLSSLYRGGLDTVEVEGLPVFFCRVGESLYAYGNTCPSCGQQLGQARLTGEELDCPTCGHRYDVVHAGQDLDHPGMHLEPLPLLEQNGQVRIALPILQA